MDQTQRLLLRPLPGDHHAASLFGNMNTLSLWKDDRAKRLDATCVWVERQLGASAEVDADLLRRCVERDLRLLGCHCWGRVGRRHRRRSTGRLRRVNCELLCCGVGPPRLRLQLMRPLSFVLLLLISSGCCMPPIGRLPKRRQSSNAEASSASLLSRIAEMLNLWTPAHVYNMDVEGSRNELIDALWTG
eukprot:983845-Prymnesium_polylepis.2